MATVAHLRNEPLVLVVDDSESTYELFSDFLASSGFSVAGASNGVEAVEAAVRLRPDVIVMDFDLPLRNGCDAARVLKQDERTQQIPILLLTGYVHPRFIEMARQAGCDRFLAKPCPLDRLLESINQLLGLQRRPPRHSAHILLVEDDDDIRDLLSQVLAEEGYTVVGAANGLEALTYLRSDGQRPDLILLDLMMPVMDGWQFRAAQREDPQLAAIPVVLLTAVTEARSTAPTLRGLACVEKPVHLPRLLEVLERR
jgi:CheY-like chemotaxis protein